MQETDKNKRLVYLDILNILSIFAVVAMHMNGSVHSLPLNNSWAFSLLVDTLCYFGSTNICNDKWCNINEL